MHQSWVSSILQSSFFSFYFSSGKWELLSPKEKILLRRNSDDGEFWYFHEIIHGCIFQSILFPDAFAQYRYYFEQSSSFKFMPLNRSGIAEAGKDEKGNGYQTAGLLLHLSWGEYHTLSSVMCFSWITFQLNCFIKALHSHNRFTQSRIPLSSSNQK